MSLEELLNQAGGFGAFQAIAFLILYQGKLFGGLSMFQMTFAGLVPDFHCEGSASNDSLDLLPRNITLNSCSVPGSSSDLSSGEIDCTAYNFTGSYKTVVRDWSLVCDRAWIKPAMTSIQMAGLMIGCIVSGQMGDVIGRWKTNFFFVALHCAGDIAASFAQGWEVFAACRFVIGIGIGGILVVSFTYMMEFLPTRWRPLCGSVPAWAIGTAIFSLTAYFLEDWRRLHLVAGISGLIELPCLFLIPESLRWSTVHGNLDQSEATINKIARWNRKPPIPNVRETLKSVSEKEKKARESGQRYTYLDVLRPWSTCKITLIMSYKWFCYSLAYYGISFGVSALAGNIFLNIFLLAMLEVPPQLTLVYLSNRIGRKWTAFPMSLIALGCSVGCMAIRVSGSGGDGSVMITTLSLLAKVGSALAWVTTQTWGNELYPTVTRNLGYGVANTAARVAGIMAPQVINFDDWMTVSYIIIAVLLTVDLLLTLPLPDTKDQVLADSIGVVDNTEKDTEAGIDKIQQPVGSFVGEKKQVPDLSSKLDGQNNLYNHAYINSALVGDDENGQTVKDKGDGTDILQTDQVPISIRL